MSANEFICSQQTTVIPNHPLAVRTVLIKWREIFHSISRDGTVEFPGKLVCYTLTHENKDYNISGELKILRGQVGEGVINFHVGCSTIGSNTCVLTIVYQTD